MFYIFANMASSYSYAGKTMVDLMLPSFIIVIIVNGVVVFFGLRYATYKEQGYLQKYRLLGISEIKLAGSIYASTFLFQIAATVALLLFAHFTKGVKFPFGNTAGIIGAILVISVFEFAIAYFFGYAFW
jgi:ABC-2 type transport system permease protein